MGKVEIQWPSKPPLPAQEKFLTSTKPYRFYIGPWGSGKTRILCDAAHYLSLKFPGNRGIIGRLHWKDFERTTQVSFFNTINPSLIDSRRSVPSKGQFYYINGSQVYFAHYDDKDQFFSGEVGWFGWDEVCEGESEVWNTLEGRLRWELPLCMLHKDQGECPKVQNENVCAGKRPYYTGLGAGNPDGHNWVWKKAHPDSKERLTDYDLITPAPFENQQNLPREYYVKLIRNNGEDWVKRFVFGSFDVFESQVWKEWNPKIHLVDPFKIPDSWFRTVTLDHGVNAPTAACWSATDHDGNIVFYRDYQYANPSVEVHAEKLLELTADEQIDSWIADPAIWQTKGVKPENMKPYAVADEYQENGIEFAPAHNDLGGGISRTASFLKTDPLRYFPDWHPLAGQQGSPRIFVFKTCKEIKTYVPQWKYKTIKDGESEQPSNKDKHIPDVFRYTVMSRELPEVQGQRAKPMSTEQLRKMQRYILSTFPSRHHSKLVREAKERLSAIDFQAEGEYY